jgi:hypothetical protein
LSTENGKEEVLKITILFFVNVVLVAVSIWVSSSVLEIAILSLVPAAVPATITICVTRSSLPLVRRCSAG